MKEPNTFAMEAVADSARLDDTVFVGAMADSVERELLAAVRPLDVDARRRELDDFRLSYRREVLSGGYDATYLASSRERLERALRDGLDDDVLEETLYRLYIQAAVLERA